MIQQAQEFMIENCSEQNDWYLKAPFVQHKEGYKSKWIRSIGHLDWWLQATMGDSVSFNYIHLKHCNVFPYLMLQERMASTNETKTIFFNMEPKYISITDSTSGLIRMKKRPPVKVEDIYAFSLRALQTLKERVPHFVCDGLIRVDVFQRADGRLVVNEIESLDANYSSSYIDLQSQVEPFLTKYFESKLLSFAVAIGVEKENSKSSFESF